MEDTIFKIPDLLLNLRNWDEDDVDKLKAARELAAETIEILLSEVVSSGWQPISTAPKNGTVVDLWGINHLRYDKAQKRICGVKWDLIRDYMGTQRYGWTTGQQESFEPTHWMINNGPRW